MAEVGQKQERLVSKQSLLLLERVARRVNNNYSLAQLTEVEAKAARARWSSSSPSWGYFI